MIRIPQLCVSALFVVAAAILPVTASVAFVQQLDVTAKASIGLDLFFATGCGACHRIAGTDAQGKIGPDAYTPRCTSLARAPREGTPLLTIAGDTTHHDAFIRTRGQLAFLSPKIQIAIRDGTLPTEVTLKRMLRQPIPLDWITQERMFGL